MLPWGWTLALRLHSILGQMRSARNSMYPLRKFKDPRVSVRLLCQRASVEPSPVLNAPKNACILQAPDATVECVCVLFFLPLQSLWLQVFRASSGFPGLDSRWDVR